MRSITGPSIKLAIPDIASPARDHDEHPAVFIDGRRRGIRDKFVAHDASPAEWSSGLRAESRTISSASARAPRTACSSGSA